MEAESQTEQEQQKFDSNITVYVVQKKSDVCFNYVKYI